MSNKPIFCCTHPRACSTAFERVFMTRRDVLQCVHEPFGDAFYYGPERMSTRFAEDEAARTASGFSESTFRTIFDRLEREGAEGKRLFIKDIIHYLVPPKGQPSMLAPSLSQPKRGIGTSSTQGTAVNGIKGTTELYPWPTPSEPGNPTVVPASMLSAFHWIFLIRDPHRAIPSYYRCCIPPLDEVTGFSYFDPSEAGYVEVRRVFDYLGELGLVGPHRAKAIASAPSTNGKAVNGDKPKGDEIFVLDADDMLDEPRSYIEVCCKSIGLPFTGRMLDWDNEEDQRVATDAFEKWKGFHEDAIDSTGLHARDHKLSSEPARAEEEWDEEWKEKYGEKGAKLIRETVDACMDDYLYMKQFALQL